jgi:lysophospholipase L1-like esterase
MCFPITPNGRKPVLPFARSTAVRCAFLAGVWLGAASLAIAADAKTSFKFFFGPGTTPAGYTQVKPDTVYNKELGYGFEPGANLQAINQGGDNPLHSGFVTTAVPATPPATPPADASAAPATPSLAPNPLFKFSTAVPEGIYKVTVTLGDLIGESTTTVKAEDRRLELERLHTDPGKFETRSFFVSVRNPVLPDGTKLKLDVQEINAAGENLKQNWDDKLTLQFSDARPALVALEIEKTDTSPKVFIMGDSTVTDQASEPFGTWGMMMGRWLRAPVVVVNYAESGETLKAFRREHRFEKLMGELKPGDYVFMQFGHNDLNKNGHNAIWPTDDHEGDWANTYAEANTDYKQLLKDYAAEIKQHGGIPVIVSPMTKVQGSTGVLNIAGMGDYPKAAMQAAQEAGVAGIDLNGMSIAIDTALGPDLARRAYTAEGLHQTTYGGYLFSRAIVEGIKQNKLDLAKYIVDDAGTFDPTHPTPLPDDFKIPLESRGGGARGGRGGFPGRGGAGRGGPPAGAPATPAAPAPAVAPAAPAPAATTH